MTVSRNLVKRFQFLVMIIALVLSAVPLQSAAAADPPTVLSVTRVGTSTTSAAGTVDFTVTFSVPVQGVDTADFALPAGSIADATIASVAGVAGDAVYTVTVATGTGEGTVGVDVQGTATITDMSDPPVALTTGFTGGDTTQIRNPFVQSVTLVSATPTSNAKVRFLVTFSDPVVGVNIGTASDFELVSTGTAGAQFYSLTGADAVYTVTVKTALGNGTLGLNVLDDDTIQGPNGGRVLAGAGAGNGGYTGPVYTVQKVPVTQAPKSTLWDTTPTFRWTTVPRATKYQFEVWKGTTRVYGVTVLPTSCTATACTNTPTTVLPPAPYKWRVQAYIDAAWKPWSPYRAFTTAIGFNSQFNGTVPGWVVRPGASWYIGPSSIFTDGVLNKVSSTSYNATFKNFTYTVRMKRITSDADYGGESGLIVRGTPSFDSYNDWRTTYEFVYTNYYRDFAVWKGVNGSWWTLKAWTVSPSIVQYDWNTLKVVANGTSLRFYINNTLVWSGSDSGIAQGQVGIYDWGGGSSAERLEVDWATLMTIVASPGAFPPPDEAIEEGQVPSPYYHPARHP